MSNSHKHSASTCRPFWDLFLPICKTFFLSILLSSSICQRPQDLLMRCAYSPWLLGSVMGPWSASQLYDRGSQPLPSGPILFLSSLAGSIKLDWALCLQQILLLAMSRTEINFLKAWNSKHTFTWCLTIRFTSENQILMHNFTAWTFYRMAVSDCIEIDRI